MGIELALLALLIEAALGYADRLVRATGHPVMWIGWLIARLDRALNRTAWRPGARRLAGVAATIALVLAAALPAFLLESGLRLLPSGVILAAILASSLLAQRSLHEHVQRVAEALEIEGLAGGRRAVSMIVGRDPDSLDQAGVARAAIESLAENYSDGIVAPALWLALGGFAGGAAYKAINTADSMIGHRTPRHEAFGWASARLDDLVNLPASRLAALTLVGAAAITRDASAASAWRAVWRDAGKHRSPNAGWPEAAMAGALGLTLAGPRQYGGVRVEDATMGDGRREATAADIDAALRLYRRADAIMIGLLAAGWALLAS